MKKIILSAAILMASMATFGQVSKTTAVGLTFPVKDVKNVEATKLNLETGLRYGWSTFNAVAEVETREFKGWSVGAGYRLHLGNQEQVFKPFVGVNGLIDLYGDKKLGAQPQAGLVVSNAKNTPFGLIVFGEANVKQRLKPSYGLGAKLLFNL